jgi:hypothetical protein
VLTVRGTASTTIKTDADGFIRAVAQLDATVGVIVAARDIRLLVLVDTSDDDQNTRVSWVPPETQITITLPIGADPAGLHSGLLHELILHAAPAARKHLAATAQSVVPDYPGDDDEARIEQEEAAEHTDLNLWLAAARIAVRLQEATLLDRVVVGAAGYSAPVARQLVAALLQAGSVTPVEAATMNEEIDAGDASSSGETSD